jgi:hypothetical protein
MQVRCAEAHRHSKEIVDSSRHKLGKEKGLAAKGGVKPGGQKIL